jgi:hypothetical protein
VSGGSMNSGNSKEWILVILSIFKQILPNDFHIVCT